MATNQNIMDAFAGESQANRKYLAFAKKAEEDGYLQIAKLFRAAADAETIHAHSHFRVAGGVKDTIENIQAAIEGEGYEFKEMYPQFLTEAIEEGNKAAEVSFKNAMAVEEIHYELYEGAFAAIREGQDLPAASIYICPVCGNTVVGGAPETCAICGVPGSKFTETV